MFYLGKRSRKNLIGVHPDLRRVVYTAIMTTEVDFMVIEGLRTPERQRKLVESGASRTMNSRHISGHAVDLAAWVDGQIRWDWPLYHKIAKAMKIAAAHRDVEIKWGGDWRSFKDGPHFQLTWKAYPAED